MTGGILRALFVLGAFLTIVPYLVFAERKICAWIQDRVGPNRVGPMGLLQPLADGIKLLFKEDLLPASADRALYILAPLLVMVPAIAAFAVIPFGCPFAWNGTEIPLQVVPDLDIGVLFVLGVTAISVFGLALGGWASNNKYSMLGGLRASAQMVSYEIALGLAVLGVFLAHGTVNAERIVLEQTGAGAAPHLWTIVLQPIGFLVALTAAFAENNRLPFDLPEAEAELVGGYHTEYGGMRFGTFFLAEYSAMITMSALIVTLYLGGWHFPGLVDPEARTLVNSILSLLVFGGKMGAMLFLYIWIRWTLPRFRYDQLLGIGWKVLIPLAFLNLILAILPVVMEAYAG